jgi:selenide,water dikinase
MDDIKLTQYSKGAGCGCKIAPSVLQEIVAAQTVQAFPNLLVGNDSNDDAAVYQLDEETAIISTTDFFLPIVNDPVHFGKIASANAISDVYAMGGTPLMAVAILGFPVDKLPTAIAQQMLEGARAICREANIPLAGGHTIDSGDPIFGLAVTGRVALKHLKQNNKAKAGDLLFLTKKLGTGILSTALKRELLAEEHYRPLLQQLVSLNKAGEALGRVEGVHALTDVTGFGLIGHAIEMAEGSGISIDLFYDRVQQLPGLAEYMKQRAIPDATYRNWNSYSSKVQFEKGVNVMEAFTLLPDPQTNGGLLIAVDPASVKEVQKILQANALEDFLEPVGRCIEKKDKTIAVFPAAQ